MGVCLVLAASVTSVIVSQQEKLLKTMAFFTVNIPNDVVDEYNTMKLKHTWQYILLKLSDDYKQLLITKKVEKMEVKDDATAKQVYDDFIQEFEPNTCSYAIFDFHFKEGDGDRDKLIFLSWCPNTSSIKQKMTYSSCREDIKKKLIGIHAEIQATDDDELSYSTVKSKLVTGR